MKIPLRAFSYLDYDVLKFFETDQSRFSRPVRVDFEKDHCCGGWRCDEILGRRVDGDLTRFCDTGLTDRWRRAETCQTCGRRR